MGRHGPVCRPLVEVRHRHAATTGPFIDRYVFPDGELTASGRVITEMQNAGFEVVHQENLRHHYAMTLRDWCANLVAHWDQAVEEVGLGTAKVWGLYLAASRVVFERNVLQLHQLLGVKLDENDKNRRLPLRPVVAALTLIDTTGGSGRARP